VWLAGVPWHLEGVWFDFLCIGCLEARIGRQLRPDDFTDAPIDDVRGASPRLRARLLGPSV